MLAHAAITKLVGGTNPLTNKPHSFASAEIAFKGGEEYSALKRELFALMHARDLAAIEARCSYLRLLAGWESTWVRAMAAKQAPPTPDA